MALAIAMLFVGAFIGFFVAALMAMAGMNSRDEEIEDLRQRLQQ